MNKHVIMNLEETGLEERRNASKHPILIIAADATPRVTQF